jgi:PQQ-dependent catabolism-associated CXXCW motif protein
VRNIETDILLPRLERQKFAVALSVSDGRTFVSKPHASPEQAPTTFSFEEEDWHIAPVTVPVSERHVHAPTPTTIPGGRVIRTLELKTLLDANRDVLVVDVVPSANWKTVPGAIRMPDAGYVFDPLFGDKTGAEKKRVNDTLTARFASALYEVSGRDKERPVVFLCTGADCWLSYNAALRAIAAGHRNVIWYRGGTAAWRSANLKWEKPKVVDFVKDLYKTLTN